MPTWEDASTTSKQLFVRLLIGVIILAALGLAGRLFTPTDAEAAILAPPIDCEICSHKK